MNSLTDHEQNQLNHLRGVISRLPKKVESTGSLSHIKTDLEPFIPLLTKLRDEHMEREEDPRTGFDTYGYNDFNQILGDLTYISDRWRSAFRINWILGLVNPGDDYYYTRWKKRQYEHLMGKGSFPKKEH